MFSKINIPNMLVTFISGFFIFGIMAYKEIINGQFPIPLTTGKAFLLFGFLGGWLVFGLFTSIVLHITWLKGRKGVVQILSILLFPIAIMIALFAGIGGCFPCLIYNIATGKGGFAHKNKKR